MNIIVITGLLASLSPTTLGVIGMAQPKTESVNIQSVIRLKAQDYGLDARLVEKIVYCESRGRFDAINTNKNGTTDKGLLQINSIHNTRELDMFDPEDNLDFGLKMMQKQGLKPWLASSKCWMV